jgi:predicted nucleic acid-binding protein
VSEPKPSSAWLVDASVVLKWFMPVDREPDAELARSALGRVPMRTTTLAAYEVGNILVRRSGLPEKDIAEALATLDEICGEPIALTPADRILTVKLAKEHDLTFYDASYAAIARRTSRLLVSADTDLTDPGLASTLPQALSSL